MYGNFFLNSSLIISKKYVVTPPPQFSFWILTALAEICFFHIVINRAKMYSAANDPETANDPRLQLIPKLDRKWSPTPERKWSAK